MYETHVLSSVQESFNCFRTNHIGASLTKGRKSGPIEFPDAESIFASWITNRLYSGPTVAHEALWMNGQNFVKLTAYEMIQATFVDHRIIIDFEEVFGCGTEGLFPT